MRMVIGPVSSWTRMPLIPNPANSATEPLALHDAGQVGVVRGVEEGGQDGGEDGHDQEVHERQAAQDECHRDGDEKDCPTQVGADEHRSPPKPVHPGAGHQADDEERPQVHAAQQGDFDRSGAQRQDRDQGQRDPGDQ